VQKPSPCYLLAFSAKTQESLQEKCKEMIVCLEKEKAKSLAEISFTLLEGRQHFAHRCAVVVQDKEDGIYVLQQMGSKEKLPNLFKGTVARDFTGQKAIEEYGQELLAQSFSQQADINRYKEILHALADLYCQGYDLAWRQLYGEEKPNRLHLPGYPFAKESYWVPEMESSLTDRTHLGSVTVLHPLLQQNTSDFSEQRFSSSFTGEEFFLKDHVVKGQRILPGVAYLEMARAAAQQAAGRSGKENVGIQIKHVVWTRPMLAGEEAVQVHIGLFPEENGGIAYEIYSHLDESLEEAVVHSQGNILLRPACEVQSLPIEQIRNQCSREMLSSSQCYEQLRKMGLEYGPGHQGIETLYIGDNQVLAKLLLPAFLLDTQDSFILHPSIMDSALQASMGLMIGSGSLKPALPFALQELELMEACTPSMWAVVRYSPGSKGEDKVQKLDIDLCNEEGTVCVRMKGFSARILEREIDSREKIDMLLYQPGWKEKSIDRAAAAPHIDQHVVILCEPDQGIQESMAMNMNGVRCIALQRKRGSIAVRFQKYADEIFEEIRAILKEKTNSKALIQIVIFSKEQMPFSGFSGLLKTAHLENARLVGQIIEAEPEDSAQSIREKLIENSHQPFDSHIRYQDGKRWIAEWKEMKDTQDTVKIPWKDEGVYLITGGAGGLGLIFAQDIARQAKSATIILTGRSALTQEMQTKWQGIVTLGARVEYRQADVTDQQAVSRLIEKIQEEFGGLHGILHCAGVIRDNFILKKTQEEMQEVLSPKVLGLVNLDQAAKDMKLDVFILFSSIAGSLGNAGQADYAAANAFMDAYAEYRNDLAARQQRQGKTLSINWPLWQEGGMGVDEITKKIMMQNMGMIALQTANGIQALYQSIGPGQNQVMVMAGKADQLRMALEQNHPDERGEHSSVYAAAGDKIINQDLYQKLFDEIAAGVLSEEEFSTLMKV
jgi:acyl transferase domain-containing protein